MAPPFAPILEDEGLITKAGAEAVPVRLGERADVALTDAQILRVTDSVLLGLVEGALETRIDGTAGLRIGVVESPAIEGAAVMPETVPLRLIELATAVNLTPNILVTAADVAAFVLAESYRAGLIETWNVPDDATGIDGILPWTALAGSHMQVVGQRAKLVGNTGFAVEPYRCDRIIGADHEVSMTLAALARADASDLSVGVMAGKDATAAQTYYQFRATHWAGGDTLSMWKVTTGAFVQLGSNVLISAQATDRLRLRKVGDTVIGYLNDVAVLGPFDSPGGPSGEHGGLTVYCNVGAAAAVEFDDWIGEPLAEAVVPVAGADLTALRLSEIAAGFAQTHVADPVPIGLGESPLDTFRAIAGVDACPVGLVDAAAVQVGAFPAGAESLAIPLQEAAAVLLLNPTVEQAESVPVGLVDTAAVVEIARTVASADQCAVGIEEQNFATASTEAAGAEAVAIALAELAVALILIAGPIDLILVLDITGQDAGPVDIEGQEAGPVEIVGTHGG